MFPWWHHVFLVMPPAFLGTVPLAAQATRVAGGGRSWLSLRSSLGVRGGSLDCGQPPCCVLPVPWRQGTASITPPPQSGSVQGWESPWKCLLTQNTAVLQSTTVQYVGGSVLGLLVVVTTCVNVVKLCQGLWNEGMQWLGSPEQNTVQMWLWFQNCTVSWQVRACTVQTPGSILNC